MEAGTDIVIGYEGGETLFMIKTNPQRVLKKESTI